MPKCPSIFCNHINPDKANYCGMCAMDLNFPKEEVENRDNLYELFKEVFKEFRKDIEFTRPMMNYMIEKYGGTIAMLMFKAGKDISKEKEEKHVCPKEGLYSIFMKRLKELKSNSSNIIRFPLVFEKLCTSFQITKKQCWDILFMFRDFGLIEIINGQGIKIKQREL